VKLFYVPVAICVHLFVCLQTARASTVRHTGDVTEDETLQAAGGEVLELHQCGWNTKGC